MVLPGCGFVGQLVSVLANRGRPGTRSLQKRMRLEYPERASSIPDKICERDKHYTEAREIVRSPNSLSKAQGGPTPIDC